MSIFDKAKHALQHAGNSIKDGAENAGNAIKHTADDAGDKFASAAERIAKEAKQDLNKVTNIAMSVLDDIKHELSKVGDGIKNDLVKAGNDIISKAQTTIKGLEAGVEKGFEEAEGAVNKIPQDVAAEAVKARDALEDVKDELTKDLKGTGAEVKKDLEQFGEDFMAGLDQIEEGWEEILSEAVIQKAIEKTEHILEWLDKEFTTLEEKAPELVNIINGLSDDIELGPVTLEWDGFFTRVHDIDVKLKDTLAGEIVVSRSFIIALIEDLGPTTIKINADIDVFAVFGDKIPNLPLKLFLQMADLILDKMGVPE